MVGLAFEVGIAVYHEYATPIEVHIEFLERWGTESGCVGGAEGMVREFIHGCEFPCRHAFGGGREVVVTQSGDEVPSFRRIIIPLDEKVVGVLNVALGAVAKLVGHEVVVHVVCSKCEERLP